MASVQRPRLREIRSHSSPSPAPQQTQLLRTCQNCFHAKIRCDRSNEHGPCDRCARLHRDCHFPPARRRNNGKRDARIEALEAKLDQILNACNPSGSPSPELTKVDRAKYDTTAIPTPANSLTRSSSVARQSNHGDDDINPDCIDLGLLSIDMAESLIQRFKTELTPHFPFVVIPPHISTDDLRQQKPLLFLAVIQAAAYDSHHLQITLDKQMKQLITSKFVYGEELNLDLLQALLVNLAWTQYRSKPSCYSQYLQLAISIITDLRLDRAPDTRPWKTRVDVSTERGDEKTTLDLDEQRAVAGCYYLSSSVATVLQKLQSFPFTKHVEDCAKTVTHSQQYPTDKFVHYIVQMQRIMERADAITSPKMIPFDLDFIPITSVEIQISQLKSELENLRLQITFPMMESQLLMNQLHSTELFLCHTGLCGPESMSPIQNTHCPWTLDTLGAGLVAAKSLLSFYLSLPFQAEKAFNNTEWIQLGFVLTFAAQLSVNAAKKIEHKTAHLRQFFGMADILKDVLIRLSYLTSSSSKEQGSEIFEQFENRVTRLKQWFESQSSVQASPSLQPYPTQHYGIHNISEGLLTDPMLATDFSMPAFDFGRTSLFCEDLENASFGDFVFT